MGSSSGTTSGLTPAQQSAVRDAHAAGVTPQISSSSTPHLSETTVKVTYPDGRVVEVHHSQIRGDMHHESSITTNADGSRLDSHSTTYPDGRQIDATRTIDANGAETGGSCTVHQPDGTTSTCPDEEPPDLPDANQSRSSDDSIGSDAESSASSEELPADETKSDSSSEQSDADQPADEDCHGCVEEPGFWEGIIPIWGSGKAAVAAFQRGEYLWGVFNTAMAVSDVFMVKAIVTGIAKGGIKAVTRETIEESVEQTVKESADDVTRETAEAAARKPPSTAHGPDVPPNRLPADLLDLVGPALKQKLAGLREQIAKLSVKPNGPPALFSGKGAQDLAASQFSGHIGSTEAGKYLASIEDKLLNELISDLVGNAASKELRDQAARNAQMIINRELWSPISARYVASLQGDIPVILRTPINAFSVFWATEIPALEANLKVTRLVVHINGSATTIGRPFAQNLMKLGVFR